MLEQAAPALFAVFVWWLGTGVVLYLDSLPAQTYRWSLIGAMAVLAGSVYGLVAVSEGTAPGDAYLAFVFGVALWGCLEMSYFMGLVSGPRKSPCPPGCRGWRRFTLAIATSLYHELSIVVTAALLAIITWDTANPVGFWTFTVLWLMRWSAKLNVFLGVPNLNGDWLPEHLRFLQSYMGRRSMNHLFPFSVTTGTTVAVLLALEALAADAQPHLSVGLSLVTMLLILAVLEHWFLVLPVPDEVLWRWVRKPSVTRRVPDSDTELPPGHRLQI